MTDVNKGTPIPGEEESSSLSPQIQESAAETKAREKGWKPKEEYDGPEEDWVDAREFLGRQKLYDRINNLKDTIHKQTQTFRQDMQQVLGHLNKVREQEYKKALKDLESQRAAAVAAEDVEAVVAVSKEIETLKEEKAEEKAATKEGAAKTGEPTPEFLEWQANNKWFTNDPEMRQDAISIGVGYAANNPNKTQVDVLEYVTKKIKKMYPQVFEQQGGNKKVNSPVESGGTSRPAPSGASKKKTLKDLPEDHQEIARVMIRSGALKKAALKNKRTEEEEFLAQYTG